MEGVPVHPNQKLASGICPDLSHHIHHVERGQLAAPELDDGLSGSCTLCPGLEQRHAAGAGGGAGSLGNNEAAREEGNGVI